MYKYQKMMLKYRKSNYNINFVLKELKSKAVYSLLYFNWYDLLNESINHIFFRTTKSQKENQ